MQVLRNLRCPRATEESLIGSGFRNVASSTARSVWKSLPVTGTLSVSGGRITPFWGTNATVERMSRFSK